MTIVTLKQGIIGWKKCRRMEPKFGFMTSSRNSSYAIVKLLIPAGAQIRFASYCADYCIPADVLPGSRKFRELMTRRDVFSAKVRADRARVLDVSLFQHPSRKLEVVYSLYEASCGREFPYRKGFDIVPHLGFSEDNAGSCGGGIHFFLGRDQALRYW